MYGNLYDLIKENYIRVIFIGLVFIVIINLIYPKEKKNTVIKVLYLIAGVIYLWTLFYVTLGMRSKSENLQMELIPFWSYRRIIFLNDRKLFWENIANVFLFLPFGIMLKELFTNKIKLYEVILIGMAFSFCIECTQLILKLGLFEFDDMFHNVIGITVGYFISCLIQKITWSIRKKKK